MLDPLEPIRKNSFGAGLQNRRNSGSGAQSLEVLPAGAGQEGERQCERQRGVAQHSASNRRPDVPPRVSGDPLEHCGRDPRARSCLDDVRFGRKPVVQKSLDDPRIGVEPHDGQGPPPHGPGQIDAFCQSHFGQPAQQVPVGRPPNGRVDAGIGGQVSQVAPEEGRDEPQRLRSGSSGVAREGQAHGVEAPGRSVVEDPLEAIPG